MKRAICIVAVLGLMASVILAGDLDGSMSETDSNLFRTIQQLELDWQSGTNGIVDISTVKVLDGRIERVIIKPDSGGTQPDANYDVELQDVDGIDILAAFGTNLSQTVTSDIVPGMSIDDNAGTTNAVPFTVSSKLTLKVFNAGSENGGIIRLYIRK